VDLRNYLSLKYLIAIIPLSFLLDVHNLAVGQDLVNVPEIKGFVTDQTGTLNSQEIQAMENKLQNFQETKGSQIILLLIPSTYPEEIEQYGIRVADTLKIGRAGIDDGVILIVAKEDRRVRIEVGYGLEGAIPDAYAKRIIEQVKEDPQEVRMVEIAVAHSVAHLLEAHGRHGVQAHQEGPQGQEGGQGLRGAAHHRPEKAQPHPGARAHDARPRGGPQGYRARGAGAASPGAAL